VPGPPGLLQDLGCFEGQRPTWNGVGWVCSVEGTELPIAPLTTGVLVRVDVAGTSAGEAVWSQVAGGGGRITATGSVPSRLLLAGPIGGTAAGRFRLALEAAPTVSNQASLVHMSSLVVPVLPGTSTPFLPGTPSAVRVTLVLATGSATAKTSESFLWYQASLGATKPRRTFSVELLDASFSPVVRYDFTGCSVAEWTGRVGTAANQSREVLSMDCRLSGVTSSVRPVTAAWLGTVAAGGEGVRTVGVDWYSSALVLERRYVYTGAFPVRYVFPELNAASASVPEEQLELQPATFSLQ
jgi:hypothetical protein